MSLRYYSNTKTGGIISRVIHDVEQTKDFVITGLMNVWLDTATIAIAIIVMFSMNIKLTFVALLILPIYVVAVKYFWTSSKIDERAFTSISDDARIFT